MSIRKGSQSKDGGMDFPLKMGFSEFRNSGHMGLIQLENLLHVYCFYVFPQKRVKLLIFSTCLAFKQSRSLQFPWVMGMWSGYDSEIICVACKGGFLSWINLVTKLLLNAFGQLQLILMHVSAGHIWLMVKVILYCNFYSCTVFFKGRTQKADFNPN